MSRSGKPVQVYMPEGMSEQVERLAEANQRSVTAEILKAIERHLAAPPVVRIVEKLPPLPPETVQIDPKAMPPKKRGRPRKGGAT